VEASGGLGAKNTERPGISASPPIRGASFFRFGVEFVLLPGVASLGAEQN